MTHLLGNSLAIAS